MKKIIAILAMVMLVMGSQSSIFVLMNKISPMDYGIIFKAPEATDSQNHSLFSKQKQIKETEIYLNWSDIEKIEGEYDWSVIDKWAD